jgi:hypothetical protein
MAVRVKKTRHSDLGGGVDHLIGVCVVRHITYPCDAPVCDQQIGVVANGTLII